MSWARKGKRGTRPSRRRLWLTLSFVHDTLKTVGKNMKGQQNVDEDDVEEHVSLVLLTS